MSILCEIFGHKWSGGKCTRCGEICTHNWHACKCSTCGEKYYGELCPTCNGDGEVPDEDTMSQQSGQGGCNYYNCPDCGGKGFIE